MDCKNVHEYLLTDYLDNELKESVKADIDMHIKKCPECSRFFETVKSVSHAPFTEAEKFDPDEAVWLKIKREISKINSIEDNTFKQNWLGWLQCLFLARPVFAFTAVTAMMILAVVVISIMKPSGLVHNKDGNVKTVNIELAAGTLNLSGSDLQIDDLAYLDDYNGIFEDGYGTDIEEYFL